MSDNIQTNTTGPLISCLQQKIDKTRYLVEVVIFSILVATLSHRLKPVELR
ncbi:MAG: hypothetical protein HFG39_02545 [Lachnospiraceae bacterium]|nr:hypothetical protein [Lachnospiraceae bacterium]